MGLLSAFRAKPRQPDLTFAADGFHPIALMRLHGVDLDFFALEMAQAADAVKKGCTDHQALSMRWGGATAIGQDLRLFQSHACSFDETLDELLPGSGQAVPDPKTRAKMKYRAAATLLLAQIMADAPGEFERFLKFVRR